MDEAAVSGRAAPDRGASREQDGAAIDGDAVVACGHQGGAGAEGEPGARTAERDCPSCDPPGRLAGVWYLGGGVEVERAALHAERRRIETIGAAKRPDALSGLGDQCVPTAQRIAPIEQPARGNVHPEGAASEGDSVWAAAVGVAGKGYVAADRVHVESAVDKKDGSAARSRSIAGHFDIAVHRGQNGGAA